MLTENHTSQQAGLFRALSLRYSGSTTVALEQAAAPGTETGKCSARLCCSHHPPHPRSEADSLVLRLGTTR